MTNTTNVLIIDDSAAVREVLSATFNQDPRLQVLPPARDVFLAAERMKRQVPDVIVLDVELPRMDGISFLRRLMAQHPIPVVICSGVVPLDSPVMRQAREAGAVDCIAKPRLSDIEGCREVREAICNTIYAASRVPVASFAAHLVVPKLSADVVLRKVQRSQPPAATPPVLVIGASTGGTEALSFLLRQLPASMPGIVIVQHMPEFFTASFADRLNRLSALSVKEAAPGDEVGPGQVIVARGNRHVILRRRHHRYSVELLDGPPVSRHRPSVDVLFRSAAQQAGAHAIGVLLTGMGDDGAAGMLELKQSGAITIAQDRESSTVFGMPNEAIKQGGVDRILPLDQIASALIELRKEQRTRFPANDDIPAKDNRS